MGKNLKEKAIKIQGKDYVLVSDRVIYFNEKYPNGCIKTLQLDTEDSEKVQFKAVVIPDAENPERFFTGHSQEVWGEGYINKTSALENAETSAVGRALALMGIGVIDSIASVDELNKAKNREKGYDPSTEKAPFCTKCGLEGIKAKRPNGSVFWTCPEWKLHKQEGEKFEMKQPSKKLDKNEQSFADSLPE